MIYQAYLNHTWLLIRFYACMLKKYMRTFNTVRATEYEIFTNLYELV
jgi:hypothetical protein